MFRKCISFAVFALGALSIVVAGVAQQGPTEAPTGFDTPTLAQDPGSQSDSNGIAESEIRRQIIRVDCYGHKGCGHFL